VTEIKTFLIIYTLSLQNISSSFFSFTEESGDSTDLKWLARKLLNRAASNRVISKQECMVMLLNLDLAKCTDRFDNISLSGYRKITKDKQSSNTNGWVRKYIHRSKEDKHLSLHQYYHRLKNQNDKIKKKIWYIPHYTGTKTIPMYPPTLEYARSVFFHPQTLVPKKFYLS